MTAPATSTHRRLSAWITSLLVFGFSLGVFSLILFSAPGFLGTDDYYHARIATEIVAQGRLALDFIWLPATILSPDRFVDHHLLFHLAIAPWAALGGMAGAKLATAIIAALIPVLTERLLRGLNVRYAALWALGLFGLSTPFLYRLLMVRTQGASLLMLIAALLLMFRGRYRWLVLLGAAYVWLYNGFVLLLAFAALHTVAVWLAERRLEWRPVVYTALGLAAGLVINPYFPANVVFIIEHLGAKVAFESGVRVGNEWYPYDTGVLLANSAGALAALAFGLLRPSLGGKRDAAETTLLLAALLTLAMLFKSRRFIEYYPAFALLFAAAAWGRGQVDVTAWLPAARRMRWAVPLLLVLVIGGAGVQRVSEAYADSLDRTPVEVFAGAAQWLAANTPPGSVVFQTDWDDFTRLFYYNTHNVYLVGLDPTYLERADPDLWAEWRAITRGEVATPSAPIAERFGARYIVSDTRHADFAARAEEDPALRMVYRDASSLVWEIIPPVTALVTAR